MQCRNSKGENINHGSPIWLKTACRSGDRGSKWELGGQLPLGLAKEAVKVAVCDIAVDEANSVAQEIAAAVGRRIPSASMSARSPRLQPSLTVLRGSSVP